MRRSNSAGRMGFWKGTAGDGRVRFDNPPLRLMWLQGATFVYSLFRFSVSAKLSRTVVCGALHTMIMFASSPRLPFFAAATLPCPPAPTRFDHAGAGVDLQRERG